jgi:hypothetical protein
MPAHTAARVSRAMGDEFITVLSSRVLHCLALVSQVGCNRIPARGDPSDGTSDSLRHSLAPNQLVLVLRTAWPILFRAHANGPKPDNCCTGILPRARILSQVFLASSSRIEDRNSCIERRTTSHGVQPTRSVLFELGYGKYMHLDSYGQ